MSRVSINEVKENKDPKTKGISEDLDIGVPNANVLCILNICDFYAYPDIEVWIEDVILIFLLVALGDDPNNFYRGIVENCSLSKKKTEENTIVNIVPDRIGIDHVFEIYNNLEILYNEDWIKKIQGISITKRKIDLSRIND